MRRIAWKMKLADIFSKFYRPAILFIMLALGMESNSIVFLWASEIVKLVIESIMVFKNQSAKNDGPKKKKKKPNTTS